LPRWLQLVIWTDLLTYPINPVLGAGFESFWLGERLEVLWEKWWWQTNQAHNGYIEIYLKLGLVGLVMLGGWIISGFRNAKYELLQDSGFGRLRIAFWAVILVYNYTEATFKAVSFVWTIFHIISSNRTGLVPFRQNVPNDVQAAGKHERHEGVEGEVVIPSVAPGFIHDASSSSGFHQSKHLAGSIRNILGFVRGELIRISE
jgi:hypothetical protein